MAKLKVFRTASGFHDAYVAAPSRKAALEAWGATTDLFSAGAAELVTDPALTKEPLANPGKVIRKVRGSTEDHVAALGDAPARKAKAAPEPDPEPKKRAPVAKPPKPEKIKPRPSRARLDDAEAAVASAEDAHEAALADLAAREAALRQERKSIEQAHERELAKLETRRAKAETDHRDALRHWREG